MFRVPPITLGTVRHFIIIYQLLYGSVASPVSIPIRTVVQARIISIPPGLKEEPAHDGLLMIIVGQQDLCVVLCRILMTIVERVDSCLDQILPCIFGCLPPCSPVAGGVSYKIIY